MKKDPLNISEKEDFKMGKGARTRINSAEKFKERREQVKVEAAKQKRNKLITSIVCIVLAVVVAASALTYVFYYQNGEYLRKQIAAETENHKIDNAMMLYFFNQSFNDVYSYYGEYFELMTGVDLSVSLKAQYIDETTTWFDSILESTKSSLHSMLLLAEAANVVGFELTAEEKMMLQDRANALDTSGYSSKLNNSDYGRALEFTALTSMYQQFLLSAFVYDDSELKAEYDENSKNYETVDYRRFAISFSEKEDSNLPTKAEAEKLAEELAAVKSEKEYLLKVEQIVKLSNPEITEEDLKTTLDNTLYEGEFYETGSELADWLFNEETKVGDTHTYTSESVNAYAVTYLTKERNRSEELTMNSRHILFATNTYGSVEAAKAKAEEVLKEWESGEKTAESFGKLAFKYTDDMGSLYTYGQYKNTERGSFVEAYDTWLFDESREVGDTTIVETDYGIHIIYFEGEGLKEWENLVYQALTNEYLQTQVALYAETFQVIFHEGVLRDLPV